MLAAMNQFDNERRELMQVKHTFIRVQSSLYGVWSCLSVELRYLALNSSPMTRKVWQTPYFAVVCRTIK